MGSKEMSLVLLMMAVVVAAAATPSGIKSINVVGRIEDENEMSMPTEESRRHLNAGQDCISYDAMLANKVPCSLKGPAAAPLTLTVASAPPPQTAKGQPAEANDGAQGRFKILQKRKK
ncbi:hypothetical protein WN944_027529 [Citrus x changshan-huyou]|uniref:Uncharacterized protein n=1 Tax=Citrus x changshan-huyou TaxID=2935761 RepID=A0AAP0LHN6_9ROSI